MAALIILVIPSTLALAAELSVEEATPQVEPETSDPQLVKKIRIIGPTAADKDKIRDVMPLKEGELYSPELLSRTVKFLEKWEVFTSINTSVKKTARGVIVTLKFTDAIIVAQIDIKGNYPYIENKVRKYLTLHAGDVYTPAKKEEQLDRLLDFYAREGYVDTEVSVSEEPAPAPNSIILTFHIHKGGLLRYRMIEVEGNRAWPDGRFISAINTYKPYSEKRLRRSLRELKTFYNRNGYPRAKIRIKQKNIDLENNRVDLILKVHEGPYVDVRFKGNKWISDSTLKKTITIFREASFDVYEIDESKKAIVKHYNMRGYPDTSVESTRSRLRKDLIVITFVIDEGPWRPIKKIEFEGNRQISGKNLSKNMLTKRHTVTEPGALLEENVAKDSETITENMRNKGYLDADVEPWQVELTEQGYAWNVTIPVNEGLQTLVAHVNFTGNETFTDEQLLKPLKLKPGKAFNPSIVPEERQHIIMYYADHGHPYADVVQEIHIDDATHEATISYDIIEGPEVRIGRIVIVGDILTSQKAIKGAMSLKEGDQFSYEKLIESQLNIRRMGAFSSVRIETMGIEEKQNTVHLKVSVDEARPFRIDAELGYSTKESFTGSLTFTNLNSFGWAKQTFLRLTGGRKLSRVELGWVDPRFLSSSFEMSTITWIQYRDRPSFSYVQLGGSLGFFRRLRRFGVNFQQEFTRNYFVEGDSVAADAESLRNNTISRTSASASYDGRDSFSNPTKGFYTLGAINFFNEIEGNRAHFVKLSLQAEYDIGFWKRLVFSSSFRFDRIQELRRNTSVPTNELLFMGGDDTVRGFPEDSLGPTDALGRATGGRLRWIINEELRLRAFKNFQIAAFFDMGSLTNSFPQINLSTVRTSAGLGVRYITPVGPVRLDYGFILDRQPGDGVGRLHFTFGYVF
jgi:outer membrane protein insertion porin family